MSDKYTAEAFLRAIGKNKGHYMCHSLDELFIAAPEFPVGSVLVYEICEPESDALALGLGLEWLRGQDRYGHMEAKIRVALGTQMGNACMEAFQWLLVRCPRPGAALAKAIIDAQGGAQ